MHQAVFSEPLSCMAHGWDKINPVNVGNKVLVIGAGIIGLLWACLFHLHGLRKTVTISEPQQKRRSLASNLGNINNIEKFGKTLSLSLSLITMYLCIQVSIMKLKIRRN